MVLRVVVGDAPIVVAAEAEAYDRSATAIGWSERIVAAAVVPVAVVAEIVIVDPGVEPVAVVWFWVVRG